MKVIQSVRLLPTVLFVLMGSGCTGGEEQTASTENAERERVWVATRWQSQVIRGGVNDSLLANPGGLVVSNEAVVFFDLFSKQVLALDHDGDVLWIAGKAGSGPGEYQHPRDLKAATTGDLWLLDPETARITVLGKDGGTLQMFSLSELDYRSDDIVPLEENSAILWTFDPANPLRLVDLNTGMSRVLPLTLPSNEELHPLASQAVLSNVESGRWAAALAFGPYFILGDTTGTVSVHEYVEQIEFPRVVRTTERSGLTTNTSTRLIRPVFAGAVISIVADTVHVLFGGRTDDRHRIVDRYDVESGRYIDSVLLPRPIDSFAYYRGAYYAFYTDLYPNLVRFSPLRPGS